MKKILILTIVLVVGIASSLVFAINFSRGARGLPAIAAAEKLAFKNMLTNYIHPVSYGNGIGFSGDNYLIAKWYIASVRTLSVDQIKSAILNSNATDWSGIKKDVENALNTEGTMVSKGRISIGKTSYVFTSIVTSNTSLSANINVLPNYTACNQQNISAEICESNSQKIGDISLAKKTPIESNNEQNVWAGTLDFNSTAYTFVTFAYPR